MLNLPRLESRRVEINNSPRALQDYYVQQGWTDGLPVVPATEGLVQESWANMAGTRRNPWG